MHGDWDIDGVASRDVSKDGLRGVYRICIIVIKVSYMNVDTVVYKDVYRVGYIGMALDMPNVWAIGMSTRIAIQHVLIVGCGGLGFL